MITRRTWHINPPKKGGFSNFAITTGIVTGEFGVRQDMSDHLTYEDVVQEVDEANPGDPIRLRERNAGQLHLLMNDIQAGDLVVHTYADPARKLAIGIFKAGKVQDTDMRPARCVEWLRKDILVKNMHPDFAHTLNTAHQVSEITRNFLPDRIESIVADGIDPGPVRINNLLGSAVDLDEIIPFLDSRTQAYVGSVFAGHDLAALVGCLLEVEGYQVKVAPPGPDGGCDLIAARGPLGIEGPTIAGQVKSGSIVADDPTLQQLMGVMQARRADKGLLVSWSGVTRPVARKLEDLALQIAYWDGSEICRRLIRDYEKMPLWVRDRVKLRMVAVLDAPAAGRQKGMDRQDA